MDEMLTQVPAFNLNYFKTGEAVQIIKSNQQAFDALYISGYKDRLQFARIEWDSPMTGSAEYKSKNYYVDALEVAQGKIQIKRYRDGYSGNNSEI